MKTHLLPIGLLTLLLYSHSSAQAQTCDVGNTKDTAYILREGDKRCEGMNAQPLNSSFSIKSFSIGRIATLSNFLKLQIPVNQPPQTPPKVIVLAPQNYQLDPLQLTSKKTGYEFQWSKYVIENAKIDPQKLLATAFLNLGTRVYLPVILGQSNKYDIVLFSGRPATITEFKITQKNQEIYKTSLNSKFKDQIPLTWNGLSSKGKTAPAGTYELSITAQQEQINAPPRSINMSIAFQHNPEWLK